MDYNLLEEKWIRVKTLENKHEKCSIKDVIKNAHLYKDFDIDKFNGVKFYPYEYLLIRFFTTLVCRVYQYIDGEIQPNVSNKLKEKKFDEDMFDEYFDEFYHRFDLLDEEHPFMQTYDKELKALSDYDDIKDGSLDHFFTVNPTIPGASGRLLYSNIDPETFIQAKQPEDDIYVFKERERSTDVKKAVIKSLPITCEHFAYILLYDSSLVPGVGTGYTSALAGNSYIWEVFLGRNLFETIVLNMPREDSKEKEIDKPLWEWDSSFEGMGYAATQMNSVSRMFYPARVIRGYADDRSLTRLIHRNLNGITTLNKHNVEVKPKEALKQMREHWSSWKSNDNGEPHALREDLKSEETNKSKSKKDKGQRNTYYKCGLGDDTWMLFISGNRGESTEVLTPNIMSGWEDLKRKHKIKIPQYPPIISKRAKDVGENISLRVYYRSVTSKWTYQKTGKIDCVLPLGVFENPKVEEYVNKMALLVRLASKCLSVAYKKLEFNLSKDMEMERHNEITTYFIDQVAGIFGVTGGKNSFLQDICRNPEDEVFDEYAKVVIKTAEEVLQRLAPKRNRVALYNETNTLHWILHYSVHPKPKKRKTKKG